MRPAALTPCFEPPVPFDGDARVTVVPPPPERALSQVCLRKTLPLSASDAVTAAPAGPPERRDQLEQRLLHAILEHDPAAALILASTLAYLDPTHEVARRIKSRCFKQLRSTVTPGFPAYDAVPRVSLGWDAITKRDLSRHAAYVLACIDGATTVEVLVDVSALQPLVAYEALDSLVSDGIVVLS